MAKLSEQIKKANVSNILKKVKSNKVVSKQELEAIEEFERQQENNEQKIVDGVFWVNPTFGSNFFGISERQFRRWAQENGMPKEKEGVYDLKKCFDWWQENINQGSSKNENDARERYWNAKAEGEEIKIARIKSELIKRDSVASEFAQRASDLKTTHRALKYRLSALLVGKTQEEIMQIIETEIDEMFRAFVRNGRYIAYEEPQETEAEPIDEEQEETESHLKDHLLRRKKQKAKQLQKKLLDKQPKPKKGTKKK